MSDISDLEQETLAAVAAAADESALEAVRVAALGKKGSISALLAGLGKMAPEERKAQGAVINAVKDRVSAALAERRTILKEAALEARLVNETLDVTLPAHTSPLDLGRVHPISQVMDELAAIFADLGFAIAEGPDIETDD
jgi:phenylalanyl-tRNA synthetase alpha chain